MKGNLPITGWPAHDGCAVSCVRFGHDQASIFSLGADGKVTLLSFESFYFCACDIMRLNIWYKPHKPSGLYVALLNICTCHKPWGLVDVLLASRVIRESLIVMGLHGSYRPNHWMWVRHIRFLSGACTTRVTFYNHKMQASECFRLVL